MSSSIESLINKEYQAGFETDIEADTIAAGLSEETVRLISSKKREPEWLLEWRLKAFRRWSTIAPAAGYEAPRLLHRVPSRFLEAIYGAVTRPAGLDRP